MRTWFRQGAKTLVAASAVISVVTHATVITAWVLGTMPAPDVPPGTIANRVFYIPPPDRVVHQQGNRESITYVKTDLVGPGVGEGPRMMGEARPAPTIPQSVGANEHSKDTVTAAKNEPIEGKDSVFSVLEVDTPVARMPESAAPAYPLGLLKAHIQGYVNAQYVVDTTGLADVSSFTVLEATHPDFITSVRDALPGMHFQPAKIGNQKVKQLVQQKFSFTIKDTIPPLPPKKKP
jgi:hypothetical protein